MKAATAGSAARSPSLSKTVGSTAAAKVLVMGMSGLLGLFTSRLIIQHFGLTAYTQYGLLTSFTALLAFADLGMATIVINSIAAAQDAARDQQVRRAITTAMRVLLVAGAVIVALSAAFTVLGLWPILLGRGLGPNGSLAAFACLLVFGLALPITVGPRIMVGLNRTSSHIASQAVVAPFIFLSVVALIYTRAPLANYLAVSSFLAQAMVAAICLAMAARALRPQVAHAIRDIPKLRQVRSLPALSLAWPMLIQMVAWTVAMQTDRLLLSHLTSGTELAEYNLASQLFSMVSQAMMSAGLVLWPLYAKARASAEVRSPFKPTAVFALAAFSTASVLAAVSPWIASFISDGQIVLDFWLLAGFIAFVTLHAAKYPLGMYMTDERGLRFQVVPLIIMVPFNLGISWWLTTHIGAGGPIIGSAISIVVCQLLPNTWYVRRDLRRRTALGSHQQSTKGP